MQRLTNSSFQGAYYLLHINSTTTNAGFLFTWAGFMVVDSINLQSK